MSVFSHGFAILAVLTGANVNLAGAASAFGLAPSHLLAGKTTLLRVSSARANFESSAQTYELAVQKPDGTALPSNKEATAVREKEVATFEASEAELSDANNTLDRAAGILQKETSKSPAALAQVDTKSLDSAVKSLGAVINAASFSAEDQSKLVASVQAQQGTESEDEELGAPAAAVYKSHSSSIFDVLEDMKEKAEGQLAELRKADSVTKHNYTMLKQFGDAAGHPRLVLGVVLCAVLCLGCTLDCFRQLAKNVRNEADMPGYMLTAAQYESEQRWWAAQDVRREAARQARKARVCKSNA